MITFRTWVTRLDLSNKEEAEAIVAKMESPEYGYVKLVDDHEHEVYHLLQFFKIAQNEGRADEKNRDGSQAW